MSLLIRCAGDTLWYLQIDVIGQISICYQSLLYYALRIGNWYTDLVKSNGIENLKCLTHANEVRRVVEIQEGLAEFRSLRNRNVYNKLEKNIREPRTFSNLLCHTGSHSRPAASMQSSTAAASSGRILRILSSAFGERREKWSQAS